MSESPTPNVDAVLDRNLQRITRIIDAIEDGKDPSSQIKRVHDATPWDFVMLGNAFAMDQIEAERKADDDYATQLGQ